MYRVPWSSVQHSLYSLPSSLKRYTVPQTVLFGEKRLPDSRSVLTTRTFWPSGPWTSWTESIRLPQMYGHILDSPPRVLLRYCGVTRFITRFWGEHDTSLVRVKPSGGSSVSGVLWLSLVSPVRLESYRREFVPFSRVFRPVSLRCIRSS